MNESFACDWMRDVSQWYDVPGWLVGNYNVITHFPCEMHRKQTERLKNNRKKHEKPNLDLLQCKTCINWLFYIQIQWQIQCRRKSFTIETYTACITWTLNGLVSLAESSTHIKFVYVYICQENLNRDNICCQSRLISLNFLSIQRTEGMNIKLRVHGSSCR